jgi:hypothetical protein
MILLLLLFEQHLQWGASQMCKLPLSVEVWGYTNEVRLPFGNEESERGLIFIACLRRREFV